MKIPRRFIAVMLATILCSLLAGCSTGNKGENNVSASPTPTPEQFPSPTPTATQPEPEVTFTPPDMDQSAPVNTPRYTLADAESKGLIKAEIVGRDGSSGNSLVINVQRRGSDDIDVYVMPGTVFIPAGGDVQRMVAWGVAAVVIPETQSVTPTTSMYLNTSEPKTFLIEAYCLDFELENPSPQNVFRVDPAPHVRAAEIIQAGKREEASIETIQTAIWVDEDHVTKQEIQSKFDASDQEVEDAFELLKRTPRKNLR